MASALASSSGPGAERAVGARAGELDRAEGARPARACTGRAGEREVLERALGVDAVQAARRHGDLAEQVVLDAHVVAHALAGVRLGVSAPNTIFWTCTPSTSLSLAIIASASSSAPKNSMSTTPLGEHTFSSDVVQADARLDVAAVLGEDLLHVHRVLEPVADVDAEDDVLVAHGWSLRRGDGLVRRTVQQSTSRSPARTWASIFSVCARRTGSISRDLARDERLARPRGSRRCRSR